MGNVDAGAVVVADEARVSADEADEVSSQKCFEDAPGGARQRHLDFSDGAHTISSRYAVIVSFNCDVCGASSQDYRGGSFIVSMFVYLFGRGSDYIITIVWMLCL